MLQVTCWSFHFLSFPWERIKRSVNVLNADILNHFPAKHQMQRALALKPTQSSPTHSQVKLFPPQHGPSEQPDSTAPHQSLLNYHQPLAARCRSHGQPKNCRLQYRAALSQLRRKLQQLLPAPPTPNHRLSSTLTFPFLRVYIVNRWQTTTSGNRFQLEIIRCVLNQQQW